MVFNEIPKNLKLHTSLRITTITHSFCFDPTVLKNLATTIITDLSVTCPTSTLHYRSLSLNNGSLFIQISKSLKLIILKLPKIMINLKKILICHSFQWSKSQLKKKRVNCLYSFNQFQHKSEVKRTWKSYDDWVAVKTSKILLKLNLLKSLHKIRSDSRAAGLRKNKKGFKICWKIKDNQKAKNKPSPSTKNPKQSIPVKK